MKHKFTSIRGMLSLVTLLIILLIPFFLVKNKLEISATEPNTSATTTIKQLATNALENNPFTNKGKNLPSIHSHNAILIEATSGKIIGEKNKQQKIFPASLTKMLTVYTVLEHLDSLDTQVTVSEKNYQELIDEEASMAGFLPGEKVSIRDLLYGTMLPSGAEAASSLAIYTSGSEAEFVAQMNQTAQKMGMSQSHFSNSTGIHQADLYSTVEDLAKFLQKAIKNETFKKIFTTKEYVITNDYHPDSLIISSRLFDSLEQDSFGQIVITGGKTGFTDQAGQCLASIATLGKQEYILVTAGAKGNPVKNQWHIDDAIKIYHNLADQKNN